MSAVCGAPGEGVTAAHLLQVVLGSQQLFDEELVRLACFLHHLGSGRPCHAVLQLRLRRGEVGHHIGEVRRHGVVHRAAERRQCRLELLQGAAVGAGTWMWGVIPAQRSPPAVDHSTHLASSPWMCSARSTLSPASRSWCWALARADSGFEGRIPASRLSAWSRAAPRGARWEGVDE